MINTITLVGRLGRDPELKTTGSGKSVCNFSLATNAMKDQTDWHNITCWEKTAEIANNYLKKGSLCGIEGRLTYESWEKDGVKHTKAVVIANRLTLIGGKDESSPQDAPKAAVVDDDIPF